MTDTIIKPEIETDAGDVVAETSEPHSPAIEAQAIALAEAGPVDAAAMIVHAPRSLLPAPMRDLQEAAWIIASSMNAPVAFQGNPERCLSIAYQAALWRMDPVAVASKCYLTPVKGGGERLSYEAQLVHAVILTRVRFAPGGRPRTRFYGEKGQRYAVVTATLYGEHEPRETSSPIVGQITPKNSPLWTTNPDQQLHYYTTRAFARMHAPDAIMGVYASDEMMTASSGDGSKSDPYVIDVYTPPPPSGGTGTIIRDQQQPAERGDLGENPWPDIEDIMEWPSVIKAEVDEQTDRETLAKLFDKAKGHGLLGRLKTADKTTHADVIAYFDAKNKELKQQEEAAKSGGD